MRPDIAKFFTTVLLISMIVMTGGTVPAVAQGAPASPSAAQGAPASPSTTLARPNSQPATASVPQVPARGWVGYRSAQTGSSQPAAKTGQPQTGWTGYAPAAAWSGYRPGTVRPGSAPATAPARPVNNMDRSRVPGPSPYHGNQPRSYHEYGSGRRISLAKPWLPGSP
jgi:hypothetical protein